MGKLRSTAGILKKVLSRVGQVSDEDIEGFNCVVPSDEFLTKVDRFPPFSSRLERERMYRKYHWTEITDYSVPQENGVVVVGVSSDHAGSDVAVVRCDQVGIGVSNDHAGSDVALVHCDSGETSVSFRMDGLSVFDQIVFGVSNDHAGSYVTHDDAGSNVPLFRNVQVVSNDHSGSVGVGMDGLSWLSAYDIYPCVPCSPKPGQRYPSFPDGDPILWYPRPFLLTGWLENLKTTPGRKKLAEYAYWSRKCRETFLETTGGSWSGDRHPREIQSMMQALIVSVLDHHLMYGRAHGGLSDPNNYKVTQFTTYIGAFQKIGFKMDLLNPCTNVDPSSSKFKDFTQDMKDLHGILDAFFLGGVDCDDEMKYLLSLLTEYPFSTGSEWKDTLLRNFPGLWDGQQRASLFINSYCVLVSDDDRKPYVQKVLQFIDDDLDGKAHGAPVPCNFGWTAQFPKGTVFYDMLYQEDDGTPTTKRIYKEGDTRMVLKYIRAVLHHFKQKQGGNDLNFLYMELALSQLFPGFLLGMYMGMCFTNFFLRLGSKLLGGP